jgi:phospholipid transport system substrate-binding protein
MRNVLFLLFVSCMAISSFASASTGSTVQAKTRIENAMVESLAIINNPQLSQASKRAQLWPIVTAYFDFELIAELTLGKFSASSSSPLGSYSNRRFATEQQILFTDLFKEHLGNIYLDKLSDDTNLEVSITQARALKPVKQMPRARVNTLINAKTAIDYSLRLSNTQWLVYDIRVEGRSLVASFRKEYNDLLLKQTPDELLTILSEKNIAHDKERKSQQ